MSNKTFLDIDFNHEMAWIWTTLNFMPQTLPLKPNFHQIFQISTLIPAHQSLMQMHASNWTTTLSNWSVGMITNSATPTELLISSPTLLPRLLKLFLKCCHLMKSAETCIVIRWRKKVKNRQINYSINYTELLNEFKLHFKEF